jgi:hypothetical protein
LHNYVSQVKTDLYFLSSEATLATCTQIVWTYIFELAFLHETINGWSFLGTSLILGYMLVVAATKMLDSMNRIEETPLLPSEDPESPLTQARTEEDY